MQADKSIMLQKQIRDNSHDLQNEFLEMKNWEQQMKKNDAEIRSAGSDQILPPVRKKKKAPKDKQPVRREAVADKPKRIKSSDYKSWDKFDVEKACEEVDKENESADSEEEALSKEELEKNHAAATEHKVRGNIFVQKGQWAEAIVCYNKAIKAFPYDAVFFANRALCHLKIDNLHSAEADCTAALQLDECYVKAYHRRATARIELKHYTEALRDVKQILKLEPSNKEARSMLARIEKSSNTSKDNTLMKSAKLAVDENTPKNSKTKSPDEKKDSVKSEKSRPTSTAEKLEKKLKTVETKKVEKLAESEKPVKVPSKLKLPDWLPEYPEDVDIVEVITKAPHQRSKKPMRNVPIQEIEFGVEKKIPAKDSSSAASKKSSSGDSNERSTNPVIEKKYVCEEIPEAPKTAVQFLLTWRRNKTTEYRYKYFKQIPPERVPTLFQDSMESNTFSEILKVLRLEFAKREEPIFDYLRYLSRVKRFRTMTMFMTKSDKEDLQMLFHYSQKIEHQPDDEVQKLRVAYEM